ncbi:hypothetical protein [Micromonospora qiuiae]|uniref:hypothetical protein n=1 Tax=Micromonospora qiuiae TaxID=502268 RepID=UPI001EF390F0|nr:hypothetical protein [Micromonospora qiuiae]
MDLGGAQAPHRAGGLLDGGAPNPSLLMITSPDHFRALSASRPQVQYTSASRHGAARRSAIAWSCATALPGSRMSASANLSRLAQSTFCT